MRNAAMRFGVGLDLWSREDLTGEQQVAAEQAPADEPAPELSWHTPAAGKRDWIAEAAAASTVKHLLDLGRECNAAEEFVGPVREALLKRRSQMEGSSNGKVHASSIN